MDIRVIIKIHDKISRKGTGQPEDLAKELGISIRTLYNYIQFMRQDLNAPIIYDKFKKTYQYESTCTFCFEGRKLTPGISYI